LNFDELRGHDAKIKDRKSGNPTPAGSIANGQMLSSTHHQCSTKSPKYSVRPNRPCR
jgi:hypothetical protein